DRPVRLPDVRDPHRRDGAPAAPARRRAAAGLGADGAGDPRQRHRVGRAGGPHPPDPGPAGPDRHVDLGPQHRPRSDRERRRQPAGARDMSAGKLLRTGLFAGGTFLAGRAAWRLLSQREAPDPLSGSVYRDTVGWRLYDSLCAAADRGVGWDKLPVPLGLATLIGLRNILRQENLYDTSGEASVNLPPLPAFDRSFLVNRSELGVYNDLAEPRMGMLGSRFGRNVPLEATRAEPDDLLMEPNPRTVSRELLTRHEFTPAESLNLFAASWIQFMIKDWFSHGRGDPAHSWEIPLEQGDPWPEPPLTILKTLPDTTRPADA